MFQTFKTYFDRFFFHFQFLFLDGLQYLTLPTTQRTVAKQVDEWIVPTSETKGKPYFKKLLY